MGDVFEAPYEDLIFDREGIMVVCSDCQTRCYLSGFVEYGCYECDFGPVDVLLKQKERNDG